MCCGVMQIQMQAATSASLSLFVSLSLSLSLLLPTPLAQCLLQVKGPVTNGGSGEAFGIQHREAIARPPSTAEPLNKPHPTQASRQTAPLSIASVSTIAKYQGSPRRH